MRLHVIFFTLPPDDSAKVSDCANALRKADVLKEARRGAFEGRARAPLREVENLRRADAEPLRSGAVARSPP
jgi:hypothetical protein